MMVSRVVIMHMGDDYVGHILVGYTDDPQALFDGADECAPALPCLLGVEAGVDDDGMARTHYGPDEVIQGHRPVVSVPAQEVVSGCPLQVRVPDGENFVFDGHGVRLPD